MAPDKKPSGAQQMFGDFAPGARGIYRRCAVRPGLGMPGAVPQGAEPRDVASLVTSGSTEQLGYHLGLARENGATEQELMEAITHLAF